MLVNVGGRERTRKDFEDVCRRAGLSVTSVTPLTEAAPFSLIEAGPNRHDPAALPRRAAAHRPCSDRGARASRSRRAADAEADVTDGGITYLSDLNMLVNVGGRERTRKDFEDVCRRAGLSVAAVTPLTEAAPFSLIEAVADR